MLAAGVLAGAAGCRQENLVVAPPYTLPPVITRVHGDVPGARVIPDGGPVVVQTPSGCNPEQPPAFCQTPSDCKTAGDICIAYTCEPPCFSQCGDYPPGLPNCPSPLVCQQGVCSVPPSGSTGTVGSIGSTGTTGGGATSTTTTTGGTGTTSGVVTSSASSTSGSTATCTDPSLAGDWTQNSTYEIATGVANGYPGFLGVVNEISNFLNTYGPYLAPFGISIPSWVTGILNDLSQFDALFRNLQVQADQEMVAQAGDAFKYTCTETWQQVQVMIQGQWTMVQPADGYISPKPYEVDTCKGTTTFDNHDISGAVSGLIPPLLDAIVQADCEIQGCGYSSFDDFISNILTDLVDCSQLDDGSILGDIAASACQSAENAAVNDLNNFLKTLSISIGVCNVQASVPTNDMTLTGNWQGSVSGTAFPGTLNAVHN